MAARDVLPTTPATGRATSRLGSLEAMSRARMEHISDPLEEFFAVVPQAWVRAGSARQPKSPWWIRWQPAGAGNPEGGGGGRCHSRS